jgi:hypothetical protein
MRHLAMLALLLNLLASLRSAFQTRAELALENLALRQQLATLSRSTRCEATVFGRPDGDLANHNGSIARTVDH